MKIKLSAALRMVSFWVGAFIILLLVYPDGRSPGLLPMWTTASVYAEMATMIWLCGMIVLGVSGKVPEKRAYVKSGAVFLAAATTLSTYGIIVGDASAQVKTRLPLGNMNAFFLGDFMAIKFSWIVSPLCALLLALLSIGNKNRWEGN